MTTKFAFSKFRGVGLGAVIAVAATSAPPQTYTAINLGVPVSSFAAAINDNGQIVGWFCPPTEISCSSLDPSETSNGLHAFLYSGGTITDLGTLPGASGSEATGINDIGQIVGYSHTANGNEHAFLYSAETMTDLGTLAGGFNSYAMGINSAGQVVGKADTGSGAVHAFLYGGGTMMDLGTLPGGATSSATAINKLGQIVGYSTTASGVEHAFLLSGGSIADLGTLPGGASLATGINDSGVIVGDSLTAAGNLHAFQYSAGSLTDLGTLPGASTSFATGINDNGQVVGYSGTINEDAFLYGGGIMTNLDPLVGLSGSYGNGINNLGQIAAFANGQAYLFTPGTCADSPQLRIELDDGTDITGTTQSVVVGQKISLHACYTPPTGLTIARQSWTVPGPTVGGYTASTQQGRVISALFTNVSTVFYWVRPGVTPITYTYMLSNGQSFSATATYNVAGPSAGSVTTATGIVGIVPCDQTIRRGIRFISRFATCLSLGDDSIAPGITFTRSITQSLGAYTGNLFFVQLVTGNAVAAQSIKTSTTCTGTGLDAPYPFPDTADPIDFIFYQAFDSPHLVLNRVFTEMSEVMSARMFLMWQASGLADAIPVPLGFVDWNWAGYATYNGGEKAWEITDSAAGAQLYQSSTDYPIWQNPISSGVTCK